MVFRDYQVEFCEKAIRAFERFRRILGVMATGGGKTICFSILADFFNTASGKPVLILVDQDALVGQTVEKLLAATGRYGDIMQAQVRPAPAAQIIVATMQTMTRNLTYFARDHFALIVIDECDRCMAPDWQKVLAAFDALVCGVTATPVRADKVDLMDYFEHQFDDVSLLFLIESGFLAPIYVQTVPLEIDLSGVSKERGKKGDLNEKQLAVAIEPAFEGVCAAIKRYAPNGRTLIFHPRIETSKKFVDVANSCGLKAHHIDGTSADKKRRGRRFATATFRSCPTRTCGHAELTSRASTA